MKTETEIREVLEKCKKVCSFALSEGPCPLEPDGKEGCCAECSFPSTLEWVLEDGEGITNGQSLLIKFFGGE